MSAWTYVCLTPDGQERKGAIEANDLDHARGLLRGQGLRVLDLRSGSEGDRSPLALLAGARRALAASLGVRNADLLLFYHQMQLMLRAGHTILEALGAAGRLAARPRLGDILERCGERVSAGSSFSASLAKEPATFPRIAVKLLEAGEASGELDSVFGRLAILTERRADVRRQLLTALSYPAIVLLLAVGVVSYLVSTVLPRLTLFLQGRGKAIPWAAQTLLDVADWFARWGGTLGMALLGTTVAVLALWRIPRFRLLGDRLLLEVPVIGGTLMAAAMAQFAWTFGLLLKSRLTALDTLRVVTQVVGNAAVARALDEAAEQVLEGRALAVALARPPIPALVQHMAAVGERSGELEPVMEALGNHYQKALDARIKLLSMMIEPVMTLFIGGIVGLVYFAFFQAVMTVAAG
ncbi:MAG: type II secretion system F family protein [Rhodocyclaceae bacterium]|nr:type II secretion system F family protein [Rhodocyclaceae bacterium]